MYNSSEASSVSVQLPSKTRSSLLTIVQALEGKCRNKDAIIVALADELKHGSAKKLRPVVSEVCRFEIQCIHAQK